MADPRIITTLGVLLGFDIRTPSAFTEESNSHDMDTDTQQPQTFPGFQNASFPSPNPPENSTSESTKNVNSEVMLRD